VGAARLVTVQLSGVFFDIGSNGRLEVVAIQPLEEVSLDARTGPVDLASRDQVRILSGFPDVAEYPGKEAQNATAFLEILQGAQAISGSFQQARMERIAVDYLLCIIG
jgi:hypothetical protein